MTSKKCNTQEIFLSDKQPSRVSRGIDRGGYGGGPMRGWGYGDHDDRARSRSPRRYGGKGKDQGGYRDFYDGKGKGKDKGSFRDQEDFYREAFEAGLRKGKGKSYGKVDAASSGYSVSGLMGAAYRSFSRKGGKKGGKDSGKDGGKDGGKGKKGGKGKNRKGPEEEPKVADLDSALEDYFGTGDKKSKPAAGGKGKGGVDEKQLDNELDKYMGNTSEGKQTKSEGVLKEDDNEKAKQTNGAVEKKAE